VATCESSGKSVDDALSVVEDTLGKFRHAITGLSEAVVDIILIGMNASLKAGHLGVKGNAFVVIANELKATADQVSGGASRLKPILDRIERSANELRELRVCGNPAQLAKLEPSILHALREIEAGNDRLGRLMSRLVHQGAEFEGLIGGAQRLMAALGEVAATLPAVAARLEASSAIMEKLSAAASSDEAALDGLFAQYTMEREREVHREVLQRFGLVSKSVAHQPEREDTDNGVLLF
jgi:methyl-accepting chemotaxis protein